jgi:oxygen-independent coproporphyrinogen-3 oxidase
MVDAICIELEIKKDYLNNKTIETIYFGGGTPSILMASQMQKIFDAIFSNYVISQDAEMTLEANPEDITAEILSSWKSLGINRLSIGIQSFQNDYLNWMNRNHSKEEAVHSVKLAQENGFENISIDLIYGLPNLTADQWRTEIKTAIQLNVSHISSYCLTIEEKTVFGHLLQKGDFSPVPEELTENHLLILMEEMELAGFEQYEISNFCKPAFESKHNSSYWKRTSYIGIGPGAHSYNQTSRQANVSNNTLYMKEINNRVLPESTEILSNQDHYNEYLLTRLRTKWGIKLEEIAEFSPIHYTKVKDLLMTFVQNGFVYESNNTYILTKKGKLLADEITLQLML